MRYTRLDGIEALQEVDAPEPCPGPGQVLINVAAAGVNFADILIGQGKYQIKPELPFSPGSEVAGTVQGLGDGVSGLQPGQRVMALLDFGGYAQRVCAEASNTFAIPDAMEFPDAAAFGVAYQTAYLGLVERGQLKSGENLLVHAAAGGVGLAALQVGRALGARVIASAGDADKLAFCREHGAQDGINYRDEDWPEQIKALTDGRGADVIYDPVGGGTFHRSTTCVAFGGRIVVIGFASGDIPEVRLNRVMLKNIAVTGLHIAAYRQHAPERLQLAMQELFALYGSGVRPVISERRPLAEAREALHALAARRTTGKLVLEP